MSIGKTASISYICTVKQISHKIASFSLALLVLFSTVSFTVEKHFCGEMLMDMAIMHKAESCAMELALAERGCDTEAEKPGCCNDEHIVIEGQDNLKASWESISLEDQQFLVAFTTSYFQAFTITEAQTSPFDDYAPPLIIRDIQLLNESFLI